MPEGAKESTRVQLCGHFRRRVAGRRIDNLLPGRQGRLLFAYLAFLACSRSLASALIEALWADAPPAEAGAALNPLISKSGRSWRADLIRGRTELSWRFPDPAWSMSRLRCRCCTRPNRPCPHAWRRAWPPALSALFVARRPFLPEATAPWAESWRRRLTEVRIRALESHATACLELGGTELPGAERAARELLEVAPFRETAHLLLMRSLEAQGNVAEALAAYEQLRTLLREELGVEPGPGRPGRLRPAPWLVSAKVSPIPGKPHASSRHLIPAAHEEIHT